MHLKKCAADVRDCRFAACAIFEHFPNFKFFLPQIIYPTHPQVVLTFTCKKLYIKQYQVTYQTKMTQR